MCFPLSRSLIWLLLLFSRPHFACEPPHCAPALAIELHGLQGEFHKNAMAALSLARQQHHAKLTPRRMKILFDRGEAEIRAALEPFGLYQATVDSEWTALPCDEAARARWPQCEDRYWRARFTVTPGEPMRWARVELVLDGEARDDPAFQAVSRDHPLQPDAPMRHGDYTQIKGKLLRLARERGYFQARFTTHEIRVRRQDNRADAVLHLASGPRFRFGKTRFIQHPEDLFDRELLEHYVRYRPGDPFDTETLLAVHGALTASGYFAEAAVVPEPDTQRHEVPITITLHANKRNLYHAGIGYGSDTGMRGALGWERRYLNRRGHRFATELKAAMGGDGDPENHEINATATYFVPIGDPNTRYLAFNAGFQDEASQDREHQLALLGARHHRPRAWRGLEWREEMGLEYRYERFSIGERVDQETAMLMPLVEWRHRRTDHPMSPRNGHQLDLGLRGAVQGLGSDMHFLQTRANSRLIRSRGRHRLLARGEFGYSVVEDFDRLPESQRFFTGGDQSVRGYRHQSLGERDANGDVIGGEYLLAASLEYEYRFLEKWGAAVFYDVGNAFSDWQDYRLHHGTGVGLRWHSPVGPVRVDVASAISEPGQPLRLHITIGPEF